MDYLDYLDYLVFYHSNLMFFVIHLYFRNGLFGLILELFLLPFLLPLLPKICCHFIAIFETGGVVFHDGYKNRLYKTL